MSTLFHAILWPFLKVLEFVWWLCRKCLLVLLVIFLGFAMALITALIFPNAWVPIVIERYVGGRTGFALHIEDSRCNLFNGHFEFRDVLMTNPADRYPVDHALSVEILSLDVHPTDLWKSLWNGDELVIPNFYLDIDDMTIVRNSQGKLNFAEWIGGLSGHEDAVDTSEHAPDECEGNPDNFSYVTPKASAPSPGRKNVRERPWCIEQLTLHLDTLRWKDFKPEPPQEKSLELFYRHQWAQVRSFQTITDTLLNDLKPYGLSFFLQSILSSFVSLPGLSHLRDSLQVIHATGKRILSGVGHELQSHFSRTRVQTRTTTTAPAPGGK